MTTLKDIWISKGLTHNELATRSGVGVSTIYKMNRKEDVNLSTAIAIFDVLEITLEQYRELDRCPEADKHTKGKKS